MGWPKRVVLVRHAESEGNVLTVEGRQGFEVATHAYDLTPKGLAQAAAARDHIETMGWVFHARYCSYYKRAIATMEVIQPDRTYDIDPRLAEAQRGMYHSMTRDAIASRFPEELVRKEREGLYHYRPWGGENWPDVELRIHSFLDALARDHEDEDVLIVCHGHWLVLWQRILDGFSVEEAVRRYHIGPVANASVTVYECVEGWGERPRLALREPTLVPWEGRP